MQRLAHPPGVTRHLKSGQLFSGRGLKARHSPECWIWAGHSGLGFTVPPYRVAVSYWLGEGNELPEYLPSVLRNNDRGTKTKVRLVRVSVTAFVGHRGSIHVEGDLPVLRRDGSGLSARLADDRVARFVRAREVRDHFNIGRGASEPGQLANTVDVVVI